MAYKLKHFRADARLVSPDAELFANPSWLAVYLGQGVIPRGYDRMADARGEVDGAAQLAKLRTLMRDAAATFPSHDEVLARRFGMARAA